MSFTNGAFTPNVKSMVSENLGGILGGTQCELGDYLIPIKWMFNLT
jgi:hypothetical protein